MSNSLEVVPCTKPTRYKFHDPVRHYSIVMRPARTGTGRVGTSLCGTLDVIDHEIARQLRRPIRITALRACKVCAGYLRNTDLAAAGLAALNALRGAEGTGPA